MLPGEHSTENNPNDEFVREVPQSFGRSRFSIDMGSWKNDDVDADVVERPEDHLVVAMMRTTAVPARWSQFLTWDTRE